MAVVLEAAPARRLQIGGWAEAGFCVVAAFGTYFCMYAFRKPFTAAGYADGELWGLGLKTAYVGAQVLGYTISKFLGVKFVVEMPPGRRVAALIALITIAHLALVAFALVPRPWNAACLFLNGLPLGMVFGLVLSFLEGRRQTEALSAGLCASFIVADGVVKSVGAELLAEGVSEEWMPSAAGAVFLLPFLIFVVMLSRVRPPSADDRAARSERAPMSGADRRKFFLRYATGLTALLIVFLLVTVLRSIRADFAPEIWKGLGDKVDSKVYAQSETVVGFAVLVCCGATVLIRNNRTAFFSSLGLALAGLASMSATLIGYSAGLLSPFAFMVLIGMGLYLPYVAVHTTIFERLIAMTRDKGTVVYLMSMADAFGYLGYVAVMVGRNIYKPEGGMLGFFEIACWLVVAVGPPLLAVCWIYFARHPVTKAVTP